ncbi:hypothetical protein C8J57DRAFT_1211720 [Mycena rebaudengoi]|nr:hypothetical protein C8J57DRAFT_1211720 [Mycena rebaudengoi]
MSLAVDRPSFYETPNSEIRLPIYPGFYVSLAGFIGKWALAFAPQVSYLRTQTAACREETPVAPHINWAVKIASGHFHNILVTTLPIFPTLSWALSPSIHSPPLLSVQLVTTTEGRRPMPTFFIWRHALCPLGDYGPSTSCRIWKNSSEQCANIQVAKSMP